MKVLHILDHSLPAMSGYSFRSQSIVQAQRALGLDPVVLTSPRHPVPGPLREERDAVRHYRAGASRPGRGPAALAQELRLMALMARRITDVARAEDARLLHAHSPVLNGLPALLAGRRLGLPVVYEARAFWEDAAVDHGTTREGSLRYRLSRRIETLMFRRADRVVVIAEAMKREIVARGVPAAKVTVVPNGVDADHLRPIPRDEALGRRLGLNGHAVFGFIGSFYHYEGLDFLLDAMPVLRERVPDCRLLLVGAGTAEPALRARAAALGSAVRFAGQVPHAEVPSFYSLMDVVICPRRRMRLTELVTPLKPLEAMAMARPVLASDVGGVRELVEHGRTGLLFDADNQESFLNEASRVWKDVDLRTRLGRQARQWVERERSWPRVVARYLDIYGTR